MTSDMKDEHLIMSPGDVSTLLDIKESTLRKYALILKEAGYHFNVNEKGQRWYYNRDVIAFKKLIDIKQSPDMTLEQAANAVVSWFNQTYVSLPITKEERHNSQHNADIKDIKEMVMQQNLVIKELVKQMDQQQKYFEDRMRQEIKDRELLESLKESMMEQKQLQLQMAAAQEEQKKKSFWWSRLLGK